MCRAAREFLDRIEPQPGVETHEWNATGSYIAQANDHSTAILAGYGLARS